MYPRTWQYRTLIVIHRDQTSTNMYGKGYGPDWKCIKKEKDADGVWTGRWLRDNGFAIKDDLIDYTAKGRLPLRALQLAAGELRRVQMAMWVNARMKRLVEKQKAKVL
jgi:hypothetical protein